MAADPLAVSDPEAAVADQDDGAAVPAAVVDEPVLVLADEPVPAVGVARELAAAAGWVAAADPELLAAIDPPNTKNAAVLRPATTRRAR